MAKAKEASDKGTVRLVAVAWLVALLSLCYYQAVQFLLSRGLMNDPHSFWIASIDALQMVFFLTATLAVATTGILLLGYVVKLHQNSVSLVNELRRLGSGQIQNEAILTQIAENMLLSDAVKSVAFREKDRLVLREAIQQDIRLERWESAEVLIAELADRFGCKQEAARLRNELARYQGASIQEKIDTTIKHIESLCMIHRYEDAEREVRDLMDRYRDDPKVIALEGKTAQRRQEHKKELLARLDKAVRENDVDQGVELLKLLDGYLTPTEAAALQESARGVFRAKLHNLGVQFSLLVSEKNWARALQVGKEIVEEYPNSRMAQEVREKLAILEQRAQESS